MDEDKIRKQGWEDRIRYEAAVDFMTLAIHELERGNVDPFEMKRMAYRFGDLIEPDINDYEKRYGKESTERYKERIGNIVSIILDKEAKEEKK